MIISLSNQNDVGYFIELFDLNFNRNRYKPKPDTEIEINLESGVSFDEVAEILAKVLKYASENLDIKSLVLQNLNMDATGLKSIANIISNEISLKTLKLNNNNLGDEGMVYLGEILRNNTNIRQCYIEQNKLTNDGAKTIMAAIENNEKFDELHLSRNEITDLGPFLKINYIKHLYIKDNKIENLYQIPDSLPKGGGVYLSGNPIKHVSQEVIDYFENNGTYLDLTGTNFYHGGIESLQYIFTDGYTVSTYLYIVGELMKNSNPSDADIDNTI